MKIENVQVLNLSFQHPEGHKWEKGEVSARGWDQVLVVIDTDQGIRGIGESYHLKNPAVVVSAITQTLAPLLVGREATDIEAIWEFLYGRTQQLGATAVAAIAGIDTALHDILSKAAEIPLYRLLGGHERAIPTYVGGHVLGWRSIDDLDDLVAEAKVYVDQGYKALKIRGGRGLPDRGDIESVKALREAYGDKIDILVDANNEYKDFQTAARMAEALEPFGVFWLEDCFTFSSAVHPKQISELSRNTRMRIATGGNTFSRFGMQQVLEAGGVDVVMANTAKAGGISEVRKIQALVSAANGKYSAHCDGGLNAFSNAHVFASAPPHITEGMHLEWDPIWPFEELVTSPLVVDDGFVILPDEPGLGTELRPDAEKRHAASQDTYFKLSEKF